MDSQLGEFEQKHQITQHWKPADKEFVDAKYSYFEEKQQLLCFHEDSYSEVTVPVKAERKIYIILCYCNGLKPKRLYSLVYPLP